jgi:hypothetical protein
MWSIVSSLVGVKNGEKDTDGWKIAAYHNVDVDPILNVPEPNKRGGMTGGPPAPFSSKVRAIW